MALDGFSSHASSRLLLNSDQYDIRDRSAVSSSARPSLTLSYAPAPFDDDFELQERPPERRTGVQEHPPKPPAYNKPFTLIKRFGWLAICIILLGTIVVIAVLGFLWFAWTSGQDNSLWLSIAKNNLFTRVASISSLVIRNVVSWQISTLTSLLAALFLESNQTLILHLASVSTMRSVNGGPWMLTWLASKGFWIDKRRWHRISLPLLLMLLAIISLLMQATSTVLLTDLGPGVVPGVQSKQVTGVAFAFDSKSANNWTALLDDNSVWSLKPPFFPAFAEYHQSIDSSDVSSVDTGPTLRAFLPIPNQQSRILTHEFSGLATVIDARVKCQQPQLDSLYAHLSSSGILGVSGVFTSQQLDSSPFAILMPQAFSNKYWILSISGISRLTSNSPEPITSSFVQPGITRDYGLAFALVNVTQGSYRDWDTILGLDPGEQGSFGNLGKQPLAVQQRDEWLDMSWSDDGTAVISMTTCFAAYDTAVLSIDAYAMSNHTEPSPVYDAQTQTYDYSSVLSQLGLDNGSEFIQSPDDRGIFTMEPRQSWIPGESDLNNASWINGLVGPTLNQACTAGFNYGEIPSISSNVSVMMYDAAVTEANYDLLGRFVPDMSVILIFQEILQSGGSVAFAVQSLMTIFSGMAIYGQMQQFNAFDEISTTPFIIVDRPKSRWGLTAVSIVILAHLLLCAFIIERFIRKTSLSAIGNAWQAVAQVDQGEASTLLAGAKLVTDSKIKEVVEERRIEKEFIKFNI